MKNGAVQLADAILLVCETNNEESRRLTSVLGGLGARVDTVHNVYDAMARLALEGPYRHIVLDVRTLDEKEAAFSRLARRYFPHVDVLVPELPGTRERLARLGLVMRISSIGAIVDSICQTGLRNPQSPAQPTIPTQLDSPIEPRAFNSFGPAESPKFNEPTILPATSAESEIPFATEIPVECDRESRPMQSATDKLWQFDSSLESQPEYPSSRSAPDLPSSGPPGSLSTDGGRVSQSSEPSLHEAVRMRMTGNDPRLTRRPPQRPGGTDPKRQPAPPPSPLSPESKLTNQAGQANPGDPSQSGEYENPP